MADPVQKAAWLKRVRQRHRLFNQLVKFFMLADKKAAQKRVLEGQYLIRNCFKELTADQQKSYTEKTITVPWTATVLDMVYRE